MRPSLVKTRKRIIFVFAVLALMILALCIRLGYIQIIKADDYSAYAKSQQTSDEVIAAKRGSILDRNGEELAISATCYTVWARPAKLHSGKTDEDKEENYRKTLYFVSDTLDIEKDELEKFFKSDKTMVRIAKYLDKETADKIREAKRPGIEISEDIKRYYPMGEFAAHILGGVTDDNVGLAGIELKYNQYLSGVSGRWRKNIDVNGEELSFGVNKYYGAEDGLDVVLTLDTVIQHYTEKAIKTTMEKTGSQRAMCIVMDPKTGDVLAMASYPDFDPNNPRQPVGEEDLEVFKQLSDKEKVDYWNKMWRNPLICDIYEPGSTFKLITTSIALEEKITNLNEYFVCKGYYQVADATLHCWRSYNPHGAETLTEAVGNSCNPVMIQLEQRIGAAAYYKYLERFGLYEKTGIDFPGESLAILQNKATAGPVGLATMSYGHGIAVTPIQLITAVSAIANGGKLMKPRMVKALMDENGNVVKNFDTTVVRQVISKQTSEEMCLIMEHVVSEGGGKNAKIGGYRIGGKTGSGNKAVAGGYSEETFSSFVGLAPMDDPQVAVLMIVDAPKGDVHGSSTAAPGAKLVLEDVLRYMQIEPEN